MEKLKDYLDQLSLDQKRFAVGAFAVFLLLIVYGVSKHSDANQKIVSEPKKESFKNGDLITNNASDYYKNKGQHLSKQYESVLSSQKLLEDQLKKIQIALEKAESRDQQGESTKEGSQMVVADFGGLGKK